MRKKLISLTLMLGSVAFLPMAQADSPSLVPSLQDYTTKKSPGIWQVADEDTTIYLFGTVHILTPDTKWRTPDFDRIWDQADFVYFEADTSPEAQAGLQGLVMQHGIFPPDSGKTLFSFLSPEETELVTTEAEKIGLPAQSLNPLRPWLASVTISVMQIIADGGDPQSGVDTILSTEARDEMRTIRYFETGEQQIRFFADMDDTLMAKMLVDGIRQINETPDYFQEMVTTWRKGDDEALGTMLNESLLDADPQIAETILYNRNAKWADTLETVLEEDTGVVFVAVGAGHLAGQKSLQHYLEKKNLTVERLN